MSKGPGERSRGPVTAVGARALEALTYAGQMALLLGATARQAVRGLFWRHPKANWRALGEQIIRVGWRSMTIVGLVQMFVGATLVLQMTPPLEPWGQTDKVANIVGVAGFRMLGPIITAVVLSGFAGASIAAELGTMAVSEEIEAMEAIALNPVRFLVVPRVLATIICMLALTVAADMMIAVGGYLTSLALGPQNYLGYWGRMRDQLYYRDFFSGLIQAGVFGLLIGGIACHEGLRTRGGAQGVGQATTMTVVYSIVAVLGAAFVFTMIFYTYGF